MNIPLWSAMLGLFAFAWTYDMLIVTRMNATPSRHPLTALQVVVGVSITIGAAWLVDGDCMSRLTLFACFAASGTPMIIGDVRRWMLAR